MKGRIMPDPTVLSRRNLLLRGLAGGCSLAASPLLTPVAFASAPWENRLIVIVLRGAMDGLDALRPLGDGDFAALRPGLTSATGHHDLKDGFALHDGLSTLLPLWQAGELSFAHAVSTPYRDQRSHFTGQDLLEAGTGFAPGQPAPRDGWLNRMLQTVPGITTETAYAVGTEDMLLLTGSAPSANWTPGYRLRLSAQAERLLELVYHDDDLFRSSLTEALDLTEAINEDMASGADDAMPVMDASMLEGVGKNDLALADFTADRLRGDSRIAAFSIGGWDTHQTQGGRMLKMLRKLAATILQLKQGLGPDVWGKTAVVTMTEFGRTVRENGTEGTDHGTGGAMLLAGGAVRGGQVHARWPGLSEADLYQRRDLMPTEDVRAYAASVMRDLLGISRGDLERNIFPGLDMGQVGRVLL
jgi:uncharacterized protein (DUF1501 family)